jgi:PST family polysaccharide transporter
VEGSPSSFGRLALRGAGISSAGFAATQVLTFGTYVALAAFITPEDLGLFAAGSLFAGLSALFVESGMMAALIHREDRLQEAASTALLATLVAGLAMTLVAVGIAPLLGLIFGDPRVTGLAAGIAGWPLLRSAAIVPDALLQRRFSFVRRVVVEPLGAVSFAVASLWLCADAAGAWGLVAGSYAAVSTQALAAWSFVRWRPRRSDASMAMWRELAAYGRHVVASEAVRRVSSQMDVLIIGRLVGIPALGQYRYGLRLASQPYQAWVGIGAFVLFPVLSRLAGDPARLRGAFVRAFSSVYLLALPTCLLLLPLGVPLAVSLLGPEWRTAGEVIAALCLFPLGHIVASLVSELLKAAGRPDLLPRLHLFTLATSVALMAAGSLLGVVAVAVGLSLSAAATAVVALQYASRVARVDGRTLRRALLVPSVVGGAVAVLVLAADRYLVHAADQGRVEGVLACVVEAIAGLVLYVAVMLVVDKQKVRDAVGELMGATGRGDRSRAAAGMEPR